MGCKDCIRVIEEKKGWGMLQGGVARFGGRLQRDCKVRLIDHVDRLYYR